MLASGESAELPERRPRPDATDDDVEDADSVSEGEEEGECAAAAAAEAVLAACGGGFGGVTVSRSREVRVGPATFYNAPIHIEHLVLGDQPQPPAADVLALGLPAQQPQLSNLSNVKPHSALCPWLGSPGESHWRLLLCVASAVAAAATIAILVVILRRSDGNAVDTRPARRPQNTSGNLTVVAESEWSSQDIRDRRVGLSLPVRYVIVSHTFSEECAVYDECVQLLRDLQRLHVSARGYYDIAYNFVVGGDGYVYEGRGWNYTAERRPPFTDNSVTLSLAGRFTQGLRPPSDLQMAALRALIQEGVRRGAVSEEYRLFALCQVEYNQSPGSLAYRLVKKLPHWSLYSGAAHAGNCTS
ncbi:peptidoglycan-recognition protein SA-like [Schistocerca serialis cubense]|uniref:peptidoglycan-recognition protein SA-like n=1 Tax=Schistocerca serialis cubense TaxID=2023355 RepID=UPI00214E326E|nr:peptidoglycan-recognition protein SA-like [Schistocerca serialis cubense]